MRNKVLEFLKDGSGLPEERYNTAMELYRKSEGHSIPAANYYNRAGYTGHNLKNICYDLKQLHKATDVEIANYKAQVVVVDASDIMNVPDELSSNLLQFDPEVTKYNDAKKLAKDLKLDLADIKKVTVFAALGKAKEEEMKKVDVKAETIEGDQGGTDSGTGGTGPVKTPAEVIADAPEDAKVGLKLIEEFPFLDDADCPDKLKILVQDKFTAWRNYQKTHAGLLVVNEEGKDNVISTADLFEMAKSAIENFEHNHAIYDELTYYKEHKTILGNHAIFADEVLKEKVAKLTDAAALKRRNNIRTYVSRDTPKIAKAATEAAGRKLQEKVQAWTQELNLLNDRLGEGK